MDATSCPVHTEVDFDPFSSDYQQDPAAALALARSEQPVFFSRTMGYWVVTRHEDIKAVFHDRSTFSACIALDKVTPTSAEAQAVLESYGYAMNRTLVNEDEPVHMARRRLLMEPFLPRHVDTLEPMVRRLAHAAVDGFEAGGRSDLVDQLLWPVPLTVALQFLGVPDEDMERLRDYSIAHTVNTWGRPEPQEQLGVAHAVGKFWTLAGEILHKLRQSPDGSGWMRHAIRQQRDHPDVITDSYLHSMMMAGIVAAHETTAYAAANAVRLLLQHPHAWSALCGDAGLIPQAVEECLRHDGSIAAWRRLAVQETVVGGVAIPAGARLLLVMASGNHDERRYADADVFDIHRQPQDHLSFGHGSHQCMGKHLARMQLRVLLKVLTQRLPQLRLEPQRLDYLPNIAFRGPLHLWVRWSDPTPAPLAVHPGRAPDLPVRPIESQP